MSFPEGVAAEGAQGADVAEPQTVAVTAEDLAELRALRAERAEAKARAEADAAEQAARLDPPSAHVLLADGNVIEGDHIGTHHTYGDGTGDPRGDRVVAVASVAPIG